MNVYFIGCRVMDLQMVKIGVTRKVSSRIKALQTASPFKLELLVQFSVESCNEAVCIERKLHSIFGASRAEGEWFKSTPTLTKMVMELACGTDPNSCMQWAEHQHKFLEQFTAYPV